MGTRAIIRVAGIEYAEVYKHWDGYPEATLDWLQDFNADFKQNRGDDPEYKLAQLLRDSARGIKEVPDPYKPGKTCDEHPRGLDPSKYTGWGVMPYKSRCGQEFEYTLNADGSVTHRKVPWNMDPAEESVDPTPKA